MSDTTQLVTVGEIARRLNEPIHRVTYVIKSRGIRAAARAGNLRVFAESDVTVIASELSQPMKPGRKPAGSTA